MAFTVDADAHVDETDATWEHIDPRDARFKPRTLEFAQGTSIAPGDYRPHRLWQINGDLRVRRWRDDVRTATTKELRELLDVPGRVAHMDKLGIDVQVIYPTLFLTSPTGHPEVEVALCRAYNRWLAKATEGTKGRLRWVAMIPYLDMDEALRELRFAMEHGACGSFKTSIDPAGRASSDDYYFPFYEESERLNAPICFHFGHGDPAQHDLTMSRTVNVGLLNLMTISSFTHLVLNSTPAKFPKLRFGWVEVAASWIPYLIHDLEAKKKRMQALDFSLTTDLLRNYRLFCACDTLDDIPYLLKYGAEDQLMMGTDYGHSDQSAEMNAHAVLRQRAASGEFPNSVADKICGENAKRFYGL